jgi:hypothetical protein
VLAREERHDERLALEMREVRRERGRGELRRVAALAVSAGGDHAPAELARGGDTHGGRETRPTFAQARHISLPRTRAPLTLRRTSFAMSSAERWRVPLPISRARSSSSDSEDAPRATRRSRGRVDSGHSRMGTHA